MITFIKTMNLNLFPDIRRVKILLIYFFPLLWDFTKNDQIPLPLMVDFMPQTSKAVLRQVGEKRPKTLITIKQLVRLSSKFTICSTILWTKCTPNVRVYEAIWHFDHNVILTAKNGCVGWSKKMGLPNFAVLAMHGYIWRVPWE